MEKVYYKVHNKLEYLRVLQLAPKNVDNLSWGYSDWDWLNKYSKGNAIYIGFEEVIEYSTMEWSFVAEGYQLKPLYDFKEYLNQIEL